MRIVFFILSLLPLTSIAAANNSQIIGRIVLSTGMTKIIGIDGQEREASRRSDVFEGDQLITNTRGYLQIRFIDSSMVVLGCESTLSIQEFGTQGNGDIRLELIKGQLRTITGSITGPRYQLISGNAAVGIGEDSADFRVIREDDGDSAFMVFDGAATIKNNAAALVLGSGGNYDFAWVRGEQPPAGTDNYPVSSNTGFDCSNTPIKFTGPTW